MSEELNETAAAPEPTVLPEGEVGGAEAAAAEEALQAEMKPAARPAAPPPRVEGNGAGTGLEFILDLPLEVSVELGRATMTVSELLQLGQGSVVELGKLASDPLEILVNQKLVARGEAVVVNEKFGVRILDVVSAEERVKRLG